MKALDYMLENEVDEYSCYAGDAQEGFDNWRSVRGVKGQITYRGEVFVVHHCEGRGGSGGMDSGLPEGAKITRVRVPGAALWRGECDKVVDALADLAGLPRDPRPGWEACIERIKARLTDSATTCRVLEDVQDRACRAGALQAAGMSLTQFTDWLRGLYPEYYVSRTKAATKEAK